MLSFAVALSALLVLVSYVRNGYLAKAPLRLGLAGPFEQNFGRETFITLGIAFIVCACSMWWSGGCFGPVRVRVASSAS